ncbi:Z1 domain-containing protein [Gracilibacillus sp. S3-1-1]|uniref:Z1 domain-containing protein n=1 Tax=Gracilibacillus pellucidus TaxID=3095368 RepID=A0ACC6M2X5_9BACI|nr:Z1 domain-containing protein [Gracilibacillus sp. S3-1-1]MDX8045313.1 Z1 domain-containing protein [Gracilibacillus sp. S3-1-1]
MKVASSRIDTKGTFYSFLIEKNKYEQAYIDCMENTVNNLIYQQTSANKPGMLLGKIQSGKTRTFLGVMGLAYDNDYDVVVILTKGTKALVKQTIARLHQEFDGMVARDYMRVYDIMTMPDNLSKWELKKKLAIVVKKETKNLDRLQAALFETYPSLKDKNILFIDDEADFASVSYENNTEKNIIEMRVIASKIDHIRASVAKGSFLQVTATPYSLYLQPDEREKNDFIKYEPVRPAFTELVPIHDKYVGGDLYFDESDDPASPAYYLYQEIDDNDLAVMKKMDLRRVRKQNILSQKNLTNINRAVINFIVGSCIRRWQQDRLREEQEKYAMIVHTERGKKAHEWQEQLLYRILRDLSQLADSEDKLFIQAIKDSYRHLMSSVRLVNTPTPTFREVLIEVKEALAEEMVVVSTVNSDKEVEELLDFTGQLQLRTPMNIFIGGQILDRGVTISNLTGFFYGRNPKSFQQDTVLQHSRMYGARSVEDIAVTRFYTTRKIYNVMETIHEFDTELREAFKKGHDQGVVFVQNDLSNQIVPCSPNKILLSNIVTLKPNKRMLPVGFQTGYKTYISKTVEKISVMLRQLQERSPKVTDDAFLAPVSKVKEIITMIHSTLEMEEGYEWDLQEYLSILDYSLLDADKKYIWLLVREGRNIKRVNQDGRFENAPDTPSGKKGELKVARDLAVNYPSIMLLKQKGLEENGWRGTPFWWPVMVTPRNMESTVYAKETVK